MFNIMKLSLAAAAFTVLGTTAHSSTLSGLSVNITSPHGNCLGATVGAGAECTIYDTAAQTDDLIRVDVNSSSVVFTMEDPNGHSFSWTNTPRAFDIVISGLTGFTINSTSLTTSLYSGSVSALMIDLGVLTFSFSDAKWSGSSGDIQTNDFTVLGSVSAVPLPAAFPLLLVALGGLGFAARRRKVA